MSEVYCSERLIGRVAIITGSGSGIGRAIANRLAKEGAKTVICDINVDAAKDVAREIESFNSETTAIGFDATKKDQVTSMVKQAIDRFGKIDILVNNVGLFRPKRFLELEDIDLDDCMCVNMKSTFYCCKAVIPRMIEKKYGRIVNIASMSGKVGEPRYAHYNAAKAAVLGLTRALAVEMLEHNIYVNAVCPGVISTPMYEKSLVLESRITGKTEQELGKAAVSAIPIGRLGRPEEVAALVAFLASDDASYMVGQAINVTGGLIIF